MKNVSFQGEHGAYSESAARAFFGKDIITKPYPTFKDVLESTIDGTTDYAVLPVENSIEGSVGESYDLLYLTPLFAVGEVYKKIEHCLIGTGDMNSIDTVYSHPQALGQCRKFLQDNKLKTVPTYDTAGSVKIIKEIGKENVACIASKNASEIYQIKIIKEGIADNPNNYTRFLILSKKEIQDTKNAKTSIIFSIKHEPGALFRIIEKFHTSGINLTKIESRPKKDSIWEYNFFVDFEGDKNDSKVSDTLRKIKDETLFFKILGTYTAAKLN